jgi:hypothetical protein
MSPRTPIGKKMSLAGEAFGFYAGWYPQQFFHGSQLPAGILIPKELEGHMKYAGKAAHRLARNLFHGMMIHQQGLESKQQLMTRLVNIGTDLFALASTCARAIHLYSENPSDKGPVELADLFSRQARGRIEKDFKRLFRNDDKFAYRVAQNTLSGNYGWLENDIIEP